MLFKNKTLLKTFLFFTTLFFINPSFALKKIYYFQDGNRNFCSADASTVCNNHWSNTVALSPNSADYKYVSCQVNGTVPNQTANIIYNFVRITYVDGKGVRGWGPDGVLPSTNIYNASVTCQDNEKMELIGCTAKCVPDVNQCTAKAGQREQRIAQCGLGTGTNCRYLDTPNSGDSKTYVCDNRTFQWLPLGGTYNVGGCEATVTNQTPLVKSNGNHEINDVFNGSGSVPLNCELTLTLTGNEYKAPTDGTTPSKTSPKDSDTGGSSTSHTNDGTGGTPNTGGTGGLNPRQNSTPDSTGGGDTGGGSGGTCTVTGQTLINGSCQCPSGQTVQNNQCTTTTNTGGGNTGGGDNSTCDPTKSICEGSGDGSAQTGDIAKPQKIENTITGSWWESEYQDGMTGVWNKHKANFENTPFVQQLNTMKNGAPNTGSCPSFAFHFLQYSGNLQPPCTIWPFLKAFFLFSTIMLCRRIIFGG